MRDLIRCVIDRSGSSAIEFALLAPVLVMMLGGIIDFGFDLYYRGQLQAAVRSGAEYVTETGHSSDIEMITTVITGASSLEGVTVAEPVTTCRCANNTEVACVGSVCGDGSAVGVYLELSATYKYTPLFSMWLIGEQVLTYSVSVRTS